MNARLITPSALFFMSVLAAIVWGTAMAAASDQPAKVENIPASSMIGREGGQIRDDNGLKMKFAWCPPGFITMEKLPDENAKDAGFTPVKVFISRGYWMGKYEVTQAEWKRVMKTEPWKGAKLTKAGDDFPANRINWDDAMEFCRQFTELERKAGTLADGWSYSLPTEAQWEQACRARADTRFGFGDDESRLADYAWFENNARFVGEAFAHEVGKKKPNAWGLHDMHGNLHEWCRDYFVENLPGGRDPEVTEAPPDTPRVTRGGGWGSESDSCRSGYRNCNPSDERNVGFGFRVVLTR